LIEIIPQGSLRNWFGILTHIVLQLGSNSHHCKRNGKGKVLLVLLNTIGKKERNRAQCRLSKPTLKRKGGSYTSLGRLCPYQYLFKYHSTWAAGMAQVVEHLPNKYHSTGDAFYNVHCKNNSSLLP
jgi:hypothetical protein